MKNYVQPGNVLSIAAPYDRLAGQGALVGGLFGVAVNDVLNTVVGEFQVVGVFELTKVGSQAWSVGDKIYWDNGNKRCTKTGSDNTFIGHATEAVAGGAGDTLGEVRLALGDSNSGLAQATVVTAHGEPAPVAASVSDIALSTSDTYSDAAVNTAVNTAIGAIETALDAKADSADLISVAAKLDEVIAALKVADLMASA